MTARAIGIVLAVVEALVFAAVAAVKGKYWSALVSMFIPLVGWVSAIRLAKPGSPWARRFYPEGSEKLAKANHRDERSTERYRRWQELIGGRPTAGRVLGRDLRRMARCRRAQRLRSGSSYGVNGEGMGHATRSEVVIESLLERHEVRVVASGAAFRHLSERLPRVDEIFGPTFALDEGEIRRWATVRQNLLLAQHELPHTVRTWISEVDDWKPDVVISDFEPLAGLTRGSPGRR